MDCNDIVPAKPGDIVIYQSAEGLPEIECVFHGDNMWLTQAHMVELYQVSKKTISEHINNILEVVCRMLVCRLPTPLESCLLLRCHLMPPSRCPQGRVG